MRELTQNEIATLQRHAKWLRSEEGGERADLRGADLRGANLRGANLRWADLRGANLRGADLRWADHILSAGPLGSRKDITYAVHHKDDIMVKCGCFWGTLAEWEARCREVHGKTAHGKAYAAADEFIRAYADVYWKE